MRHPINRGFPIYAPLGGTFTPYREVFRPPAGADDVLWRVTLLCAPNGGAYGPPTLRVAPAFTTPLYQGLTLPELTSVPNEGERMGVWLREFPMRGAADMLFLAARDRTDDALPPDADLGDTVFLAYAETEEPELRQPNRLLDSARLTAPYTTRVVQAGERNQEVLVHRLEAGVEDLVTLSVAVQPGQSLELRFYDGSFAHGRERYFVIPLLTTTPGYEITYARTMQVLDRHPMVGPGSIRLFVRMPSNLPDQPAAVVQGVVSR